MITLFSERPEQVQKPYVFAASVVLHTVGVGLLAFGILSAPKVRTPSAANRMAVRHLDLHSLEAQLQRAKLDIEYPQLHPKKQTSPPGRSTAAQQMMRQAVQAPPGPQTLLQPDILKPVTLFEKIPVPTVVVWSVKKSPEKTIVPPVPLKPAAAIIKPSIQLPNDEQNLADIAIAAANIPAPLQPILSGTTTPVVISGPKPTPPVPVTTAAGASQPTSTALMSLSDSHMANGVVRLPPVNESASSNAPGGFTAGEARDSERSTSGQSDFGQGHTTAHITRSITGQFGAVVVGSSLEDQFPDMPAVWSGRLSYTAYLPVGLAKSWILQYSLPRYAEAAAAGKVTHIEAPWPYNIVRPNIAFDSVGADAIMVRGFVNQAGRFEGLTVVFPPQLAQAQFVLSSLAQWQWRPAMQNGQKIKVEVLLIIPEEPE